MDDSKVPINSSSIGVDYNDPPKVSVALLKGKDLPGRSKPWMDSELPVDILLLTVEDCEFLSCISYLNPGFCKSYHQNLGYVYFGTMGEDECLKVAVMACFVGSAGPGASFVTVRNAVTFLSPKCVFNVGFCSGLNYNRVKLGDVVISGKYLTEREIEDRKSKIQKRSITIPLSSRIATIIKRAADGWLPPLIDPKELAVKVHSSGMFLSGTKELYNVEQGEELIKQFPEAFAIDTESEGEKFQTLYDQSIPKNIIAPHLYYFRTFKKAPVSFPSVPLSVLLQAICLALVKVHVPLNYDGA